MERIRTGCPPLDGILGGGFPRHSINVIAGEPGAGKTMLAQQIVFASPPAGRPALYLTTLSEPLSKVLTYLQATRFADVSRVGQDVIYHSLAEELREHPEQLPARVEALIRQHRPRLVVIDSFKAVADLMEHTRAWRRAVYETAALLSAYDTTTFLVGEYPAPADPAPVEFAVADGILWLQRRQAGARDDRLLRVGKLRGSAFLDGRHSFSIDASGLQVYPRLLPPAGPLGPQLTGERLQTGVRGLDRLVGSGWLRGTSTIVAGPSGAGKTIVGLHYLREGARRGEAGLLLTFQEHPAQIERLVTSLGWDPGVLSREQLDVLYVSPVELHIDSLVHDLVRRIERQGVRRLVVDALGDLERGAGDPRRFADYVYALAQHAACRGVTTLLLLENDSPLDGPLQVTSAVSHLSDNTVRLGMELRGEGELVRTVRVIKSRASAHDGSSHVLHIGPGGAEVS